MVGPFEEVADLGGEADGLVVVGATEGVALAEWGVEAVAVGVEVVDGGVEVVAVGVEVTAVGVEVAAVGVEVGCVEVGCVEAAFSSVIRLCSGTYTTIFASRPSTVLPPGTKVRI